jgi:diaphanous 2
VGCLQLINAIVATPDDMEFRLHLRNEIMRAGLIDVFEASAVDKGVYFKLCSFSCYFNS